MGNKKAQITIFIIVAIIIVASAVGTFVFKDKLFPTEIPSDIEPVYNSFLSCLENEASIGIDVLESQGGYIELPDFEAGSSYMPFGSQLDFLGNPIPYWYYVSGNNIQKEQVPSEKFMEAELENFIEKNIRECVLNDYYLQGFEIEFGEPKSDVSIENNKVTVGLNMNVGITKGEESSVIKDHKISVNSKLGTLYNSAKKIYDYEQDNLFLEEYAVDNLRLYAPVDGIELTCAPLVWNADDVFVELKNAIEANTLALKSKGNDYSLKNKENKYFVLDIDVGSGVRFINSKNWANGFEVAPAEGSVLIAKPVGNQEGLGILGFCYVPYHFVYNVRYPVLIQVYSGDEIFQFPVAVVLNGNKPREALDVSASEVEDLEICKNKNTQIEVNLYDSRMNPVDANVSFECFASECSIGETTSGLLNTEFPQCVNGYIIVKANGFKDARELCSTVESGTIEIFLDKLYEVDIELKLDGKGYNKDAIISFISNDSSETIIYPEQKKIKLSEGQYEVQVYVYKNSSLEIEESSKQYCTEVPSSGISALFEATEEKCFDINIPAQIVSNVLSGGGKENYYIVEPELENSNIIEINADSLPTPTSIEKLQDNYNLFETRGLDVTFK